MNKILLVLRYVLLTPLVVIFITVGTVIYLLIEKNPSYDDLMEFLLENLEKLMSGNIFD